MKRVRFEPGDSNEQRTRKLNDLASSLVVDLSNGITVAQHMAALWREVDFAGPVASISILVPLTVEPAGVMLVYLRNRDTNEAFGVAFDWTFAASNGTGQIVTTAFSGLATGNYRARLLVVRE